MKTRPATRYRKHPTKCNVCLSTIKKQVYLPKKKLYVDHCKKCGYTVEI